MKHDHLRPDRPRRTWLFSLVPFVLVVTAIVTIVGSAQAAQQSTYSATITPNVVVEGTTNNHTFTIEKVSGGNSIGSVNIVVPPQFTVILPFEPITPMSVGKDWSAVLNGSTIELRAAQTGSQPSLKNGQSLSLPLTLTAAPGCAPGSYPFDVTAKESRIFSGNSTIDGNDPSITCYDFICEAGECDLTDGTTSLTTDVPPGARLGVNFKGIQSNGCDTGQPGISRVQLDPLNYPQDYSVSFVVPGATGSTDVCKSNDGGITFDVLADCSSSNPAPCIASSTGGPGGREYVLILKPVDPEIDW